MAGGPNLFARLHKWATRQDENFLTESLAVVLEHLLILAPAVGVPLVSRLTDAFLDVPAEQASSIEIQTQVEFGEGRPDLELRSPNRLVLVEVNAESELRRGQLLGYRTLLASSGFEFTRLVLLTRYPETFAGGDERPDVDVRWFELLDWIEEELPAIGAASEAAGFATQQFVDFLRIRGTTLAQVSHTMPDGLWALSNLLNMLVEAGSACRVSVKKPTRLDYIGISLDNKYWVGIHLTDPDKLWFGTYCSIQPEAAARLGVGELTQEPWVPGRYRWWRGVELGSEEVHFFAHQGEPNPMVAQILE